MHSWTQAAACRRSSGIENLSVSRICHPSDRLTVGQSILAAVRTVEPENRRISLTHRELLGTWAQNAALFSVGETVRGVVRSIEPYGVFIELTPNLSGLAEPRADLRPGMAVSVYIKSILPQRMKVKLTIIDVLSPYDAPTPPRYFITGGHIDAWTYTPVGCDKKPVKIRFRVNSKKMENETVTFILHFPIISDFSLYPSTLSRPVRSYSGRIRSIVRRAAPRADTPAAPSD